MLRLRKGATDTAMPREVWFALGIAHCLHSMYGIHDLVVTDFRKDEADEKGDTPAHYVLKLRIRDMRRFDQEHWAGVLKKALEPMGFQVWCEVQHLCISFRPDLSGRVHAVETAATSEGSERECQKDNGARA